MKPLIGILTVVGLVGCSTVTEVPPLVPQNQPPPMPMVAPLAAGVTARPPKPLSLIDTNNIYIWDVQSTSNNVVWQELWIARDRPFGIVVGQAEGLFRLETSPDLVTWQTVVTTVSTGTSQVVYIDAFGDKSRFFRLKP